MGTLQTLLVLWWQTCYLRANNKPYFCMMVAHKAFNTGTFALDSTSWLLLYSKTCNHDYYSSHHVPTSVQMLQPWQFPGLPCSHFGGERATMLPSAQRLFPFRRRARHHAVSRSKNVPAAQQINHFQSSKGCSQSSKSCSQSSKGCSQSSKGAVALMLQPLHLQFRLVKRAPYEIWI